MSFLTRFIGASEARSVSLTNDEFIAGVAGGLGTKAGKRVSPDGALQLSTVWACVRVLSDSVSTLPIDTFQRVDGTRRPFRPRPSFMDFEAGPSTKVDVLSGAMVSLLLHGNAYIATHRITGGAISYLEVLNPDAVEPFERGSSVFFRITGSNGVHEASKQDILHIRGMGLPGELKGLSPISAARETIGLGLAATEYGATFFGNGAIPGMVLEVPGKLSPTGATALREGFNSLFGGSGNANKLMVATDGATFQKISLAPDDAQFLETRKFQVNDIARIYGVPTSLLQHSDGPEMGQSIQDKNTQFVQHSLRPWVERIEAALTGAIRSSIPSARLNARPFVKINMDGLLRGDHETRFATYGSAVVQGILTINEVRAYEDLPPVAWGDEPISVQVQDGPQPEPTPPPSEEDES